MVIVVVIVVVAGRWRVRGHYVIVRFLHGDCGCDCGCGREVESTAPLCHSKVFTW